MNLGVPSVETCAMQGTTAVGRNLPRRETDAKALPLSFAAGHCLGYGILQSKETENGQL